MFYGKLGGRTANRPSRADETSRQPGNLTSGFKRERGNGPVGDWLSSLTKLDCKIISAGNLTAQPAWPAGSDRSQSDDLRIIQDGRREKRMEAGAILEWLAFKVIILGTSAASFGLVFADNSNP